ncbi:ankyrin repeat domain-containing protein [uncultured Maribacter sp.]|uniref:ankyrin repeat domain-containing protein n=1 Tax=uncultured Maribacter sp. TaxID=431308 RepID=UPI0026367A43|nr:ankyrin repeat domain-containing protein [uncultured Maribacter sp.]
MEVIDQISNFIQKGDNEKLKEILDSNPDLANEKTKQGISFLTFAAYCNNNLALELVKNLKATLDIYEKIILGDLMQVKEYFYKYPSKKNQYATDGFTPIGLACFFGHYEIVCFFIEFGSDINIASNNAFEVTPLHSACATSNYKIAELLVQNKANVNAAQQRNITPLHSASYNGRLDLVKLLVTHGAKINAKMQDGRTPLSMANEKSFIEVSQYLKQRGGI